MTSAVPVRAAQVLSYEFTQEELVLLVEASGSTPLPGTPVYGLSPRSDWQKQEAVKSLRQRGLLSAQGSDARVVCAMETLAAPDVEILEIGGRVPHLAVSRQYVAAGSLSSFAVAYNTDHPDRHKVRFPLPGDEVFPITRGLLASCRVSGVAPFELVLSLPEYGAVGALVDLYSQGQTEVTPLMLADAFAAAIQSADRRSMSVLVKELSPAVVRIPDAIGALDLLTKKGLMTAVGSGHRNWRFAPEFVVFCHSLSRTEAAVGLTAVSGRRGGWPSPTGFTAFWSTSYLWLADFESDEDGKIQARIASVLPAELSIVLRAIYNESCHQSLASSAHSQGASSTIEPWERKCPGCRVCREEMRMKRSERISS